jgi:hypothetical protein
MLSAAGPRTVVVGQSVQHDAEWMKRIGFDGVIDLALADKIA